MQGDEGDKKMRCPRCHCSIPMRGYGTKCTRDSFKDFYKRNWRMIDKHFPKECTIRDHHNPHLRILIEKARIYFGYSWKTTPVDIYFRLHDRWKELKNGKITRFNGKKNVSGVRKGI